MTLATLNEDPAVPAAGDKCTAMGHGKTGTFKPTSFTMLEAELVVGAQDVCSEGVTFDIGPDRLCTLPEDTAICGGDSGGPLVCGEDQAISGIVSFTNVKGCTEGPNGFTRVSSYIDFIREVSGPILVAGGLTYKPLFSLFLYSGYL